MCSRSTAIRMMSREALAKMSSFYCGAPDRTAARGRLQRRDHARHRGELPALARAARFASGLGASISDGCASGASDFGFFGQLSQLAHFDPTPAAIAAAELRASSHGCRISMISRRSTLTTRWPSREEAAAALHPFFVEVGRVYAPFLIANARALDEWRERSAMRDRRPAVGAAAVPYQGKCLKWMREARGALSPADRDFVDVALESTGVDAIFSLY